jgi:hypothetical protein
MRSLTKGPGVKKRVVSILSRQAARSVKEDEKALKKAKISPEPKATISKQRKLDWIPSTEPKVDEAAEKTLHRRLLPKWSKF